MKSKYVCKDHMQPGECWYYKIDQEVERMSIKFPDYDADKLFMVIALLDMFPDPRDKNK